MALRDFVVRWFGESVARGIEQFVDGEMFGDTLIPCQNCKTPIPSALITKQGCCPVCEVRATNELSIEALEARRRVGMAASEEARQEIEEIEGLLRQRRKGK